MLRAGPTGGCRFESSATPRSFPPCFILTAVVALGDQHNTHDRLIRALALDADVAVLRTSTVRRAVLDRGPR